METSVSTKCHAERIQLACSTRTAAWNSVECDWYPEYHIGAYAGWLSVPGGLVEHHDEYHVFYQHHPFSENWGPMHWGHVTSKDLVHWQHQPIALAPGDEQDLDGCFSGSAVTHEGRLYLFYTGHRWIESVDNEERIYQQQCLAVSEDGINFTKLGAIIQPPAGYMHFRDPKVWFQEGQWWMVCGARDTSKDLGQLLLFWTDNIEVWPPAQFTVLERTHDKNVFMWECPDFFPLDGLFVLLFSPQGKKGSGYEFRNRFHSGCLVGTFDPQTKTFDRHGTFKEIDRGQDFYAPQTFFTAEPGRRLAMGWLDMWESPMPSKGHGWSGCLTLPRELRFDGVRGKVLMRPVEELKLLRGAHASLPPSTVMENTDLPLVEDCTAYEVEIVLNTQSTNAEKYGLWLGHGAEFYVDAQSERLVLNRHYPEHMLSGYRSCALPSGPLLHLRVFVDRSSMEVFVNDGEETFSARIYPRPGDRALHAFSINGNTDIVRGDVWQLRSTVSH